MIAATNTETGNPLMHGEVTAIFAFYDLPKVQRPSPKETIFIATHEPCPHTLHFDFEATHKAEFPGSLIPLYYHGYL